MANNSTQPSNVKISARSVPLFVDIHPSLCKRPTESRCLHFA